MRRISSKFILLCLLPSFSRLQRVSVELAVPAPAAESFCPDGMLGLYNGGPPCLSDAQCQNMATGFFCYQGHCCSLPITPLGGYGSACVRDQQCLFPNSQCQNQVCYCRQGSSFNGMDCIPQAAYDPRPNAGCAPGQLRINGACYSYTNYGGYCDYARQCNFQSGICVQKRCVCPPGMAFDGLRCFTDPQMPESSYPCPVNQARINGLCWPIVGAGEQCVYDLQCRTAYETQGMFCGGGICRYTLYDWHPGPNEIQFPVCRNPNAEVELSGATIPKDCIYQRCSPGFHCEYNALYKGGQYICCGASLSNPLYGQPKMYPGYSNLPLQCNAINSCTFVDFPFCVYSESYRHKVCCSKPQCV